MRFILLPVAEAVTLPPADDASFLAWFLQPVVLGCLGAAAGVTLLAMLFGWERLAGTFRAKDPHALTVEGLRHLLLGLAPSLVDLRDLAQVRGPDGFLHGSVCIPVKDLPRRLGEIDGNPRRPVVLLCETSQIARQVAPWLRAQGFAQVFYLQGGLRAWRKADMPVYHFSRSHA